jgi:hypothetical protein
MLQIDATPRVEVVSSQLVESEWLQLRGSLSCLPHDEDPMWLEGSLIGMATSTGPCTLPLGISGAASTVPPVWDISPGPSIVPTVHSPTMESVHFGDSCPSGRTGLATDGHGTAHAGPQVGAIYINTTRGASPGSLEAGVIPDSSGAFVQLRSKPIQPSALPSSPVHRRCPCHNYVASALPLRSSRLTKKAWSRVPVVAAAQNILMHKLGLVTGEHVESEDFYHYLKTFKDGLTEEQVNLIRDMFKELTMDPVGSVVAEEED